MGKKCCIPHGEKGHNAEDCHMLKKFAEQEKANFHKEKKKAKCQELNVMVKNSIKAFFKEASSGKHEAKEASVDAELSAFAKAGGFSDCNSS